jgi:hypothetical protein
MFSPSINTMASVNFFSYLCGRWEEGDLAARRALRLSPRDPFSALYYGIAAYAQFIGHHYDEAIRLSHEAIRQRGDFVGGHRVPTAAARHGRKA